MKTSPYELVSARLLKNQPAAKRFGRLINGKWIRMTASLQKTRQGVRWRMFWRLKLNRAPKLDNK